MSLINEKYIYVDLEASNNKEIFEKIGSKLHEDRVVKDTFVKALIEREGEYPTGLPLPIGVAIPHTDASHVNHDQLAIATLSEPVDFIEMGSEEDVVKVELVIMIVMKDGNNHLEMLQNILGTVQDEEIVSEVLNEKDPQKIKSILEKNILKDKGE